MIASLYQSGSVTSGAVRVMSLVSGMSALGEGSGGGDAEDRCRIGAGVEQDALARAPPAMLPTGEQFLGGEGFNLRETHFRQRELDDCLVRRERVEVDGDENAVSAVLADLAVEQHVGVVGEVEAQIGEVVQRRVLAADAVEERHLVLDVAGAIPVPDLQFVLLRMEIFLAVGNGAVLAELEAAVDAVGGRQRGGEDKADAEGGPTPLLQMHRQD